MLQINGKTFMNLQEAVQWLLDNNALPFQSSANYVANTEIGMGTIVNPSPAKVRIGSLIFFADSKVSTVVGLTENGFIVSDQYNDLVDDVVYVSNVALNGNGHLIVTLSNGDTIDAGLIKQVTGFSINASQHLIVSYNDSTSTDLGAIFSGNVTISGNLTVTGGVSGNAITGDSIIENMSGYSFTKEADNEYSQLEYLYAGVVKTGNKITFVLAVNVLKLQARSNQIIGRFTIPSVVGANLYPVQIGLYNYLVNTSIKIVSQNSEYSDCRFTVAKSSNNLLTFNLPDTSVLHTTKDYIRAEVTFLLSENLAS